MKAGSKRLISLGLKEPSITCRGLMGNPFIVTSMVSGFRDPVTAPNDVVTLNSFIF